MTEFDEKLDHLRLALFERPEVQEYFRLKSAIEKDPGLRRLTRAIRAAQKAMAQQVNDDALYGPAKAEYERLTAAYQSDPLVVNYEAAKAAIDALLNELKTILESA